ncbi:Threonine--Trna Ligase [Manis pentadactyla]|nr:Threonine--Trna Ligase [Manis pentadactyla]
MQAYSLYPSGAGYRGCSGVIPLQDHLGQTMRTLMFLEARGVQGAPPYVINPFDMVVVEWAGSGARALVALGFNHHLDSDSLPGHSTHLERTRSPFSESQMNVAFKSASLFRAFAAGSSPVTIMLMRIDLRAEVQKLSNEIILWNGVAVLTEHNRRGLSLVWLVLVSSLK